MLNIGPRCHIGSKIASMSGDGFHRGGGGYSERCAIRSAGSGRDATVGGVVNSRGTSASYGNGNVRRVVVETNGWSGIFGHVVDAHGRIIRTKISDGLDDGGITQ